MIEDKIEEAKIKKDSKLDEVKNGNKMLDKPEKIANKSKTSLQRQESTTRETKASRPG